MPRLPFRTETSFPTVERLTARLKLSWGVVLSRTGRELPRPNLALFLGAAYLL